MNETATGRPRPERVDFYVLKSSTPKQRWTFACRLAEKAYLRNLRVLMLCDSDAETLAIDELLWTFRDGSFVPHERAAPGDATAERMDPAGVPQDTRGAAGTAPVQLTPDLGGIAAADVLVNLGATVPSRLERFARIAEIIDADDVRRTQGRERFKAYRDLKLTVETHHDE